MTKARDIASAIPAPSTVDATELGYLDGVTSAVQTQIDSKIGSASAINPTIVDAKGDLIVGSAADTAARLAVGTNDYVLTADSAATNGVKWAALPASGVTFVGARAGIISGNQQIANTTNTLVLFTSETAQPNFDTDSIHSTVTNTSRFTVPTGKGGYWLCIASIHFESNGNGFRVGEFILNTDLVTKGFREVSMSATDSVHTASTVLKLVAGDYVEFRVYQNSGGQLAIQADSYNNQFVFAYLGA